ncbi:MAG: hypothetical protein ACRED5_18270 [Propylenella sp.]
MGEAKRRKTTGERVSWCRTCTLCCTLPEIGPLDKPMYRPCRHIAGQGCGIFGKPERPAACIAYECAYLTARRTDAPDRNRIPHPLEAGAYFHRDPAENVYVVFVDPARPEVWKRSAIVDYLRPRVKAGASLLILDRGRRMVISSATLFEEVLQRDYVAFADAEGRPLDFPEYAEAHA